MKRRSDDEAAKSRLDRLNKLNRRDLLRSAGSGALIAGAAGSGAVLPGSADATTRGAGNESGSNVTSAGPASSSASQFGFQGGPSGRRSDAWVGLHVPNARTNLEAVRVKAGGRPVMGVVKANAYGHGLVQMARVLGEAGVDALMVANTQEVMQLREAGIELPIMNFGVVTASDADLVVENDIEQVIFGRESVSGLVASAAMQQRTLRLHVHIDTGLGRIGVPHGEALEVIEYVGGRARVQIAGVSTTFTEDPEFDRVQLRRFLEICDSARAAGIEIGRRHAASSAALMDFPDAHLDMVRVGIALYGHYPSDRSRAVDSEVGLMPVAALRCRVVQVKRLRQGDSVGYHRGYVASSEQTVATLPVGHSDGYPVEAGDAGAYAWIRGTPCPLVGPVTSNHCVVRAPDELEVRPGEVATLIANGEESALGGFGFGGTPQPQAGSENDPRLPLAHRLSTWTGRSVYRTHIELSPNLPRTLEGVRRRR